MTWNYRIVRHRHNNRNAIITGDKYWYDLRSVHYDESAIPDSMGDEAETFECQEDEGPDGIIKALERALQTLKTMPVLTVEEIKGFDGKE